jgi:hypothetical protein
VRALRFVYDDYSSSSETLLENAKVPTLQVRRIRTMALETYKILHNLAPVFFQNLLHTKNSKYYFRYRNILDVPQVRTTTRDHSVLQQLLCGIAYQTTSGLKIVSHILGTLFSPGLVLIAVVLLANKKLNLFFLPQFKCNY